MTFVEGSQVKGDNRMLKWRSIFGPWFLSKPSWSETKRAQYDQGVLREEGATLVEMALCSSVLLSMVFGIIGLSMAFYAYDFVSNAAREGARWAIVRGSQSCSNTPNLTNCNATAAQIQSYIQGLGYPGITSANVNVTTTWFTASAAPPTTWSTCTSGTCNIPGNGVQVKVTYAVPLGVPFVNVTTMTLGSTSFMVISQ